MSIGNTCIRVNIELERLHLKELEKLEQQGENENNVYFSEAEDYEQVMNFG